MMCTQKAHKRKFEMSKFVSPRGLSTFFENFPRGNRALIFLVKNLMEKSTKNDQWSHVLYHNFINFDAIRLKAKYFTHLIVIPMCVEQKNWKNKYVHTYGTKSQKLVKNWLKIHFLRVCLLCAHTVGQFSYIESSNTPLWHISISLGKPWRL